MGAVPPTLTIVIIGRNVARQLEGAQRGAPADMETAAETIYVDSDSSDGSVDVARRFGWRIVQLAPEGVICPAARRYAGAREARGEYILFLDADMVFQSSRLLAKLLDDLSHYEKDGFVGITGFVTDLYPNGRNRRRGMFVRLMGDAKHFGGMVLLKREALFQCGNWNPNVLANEEVELHARLKKHGFRVMFHPWMECLHLTRFPSPLAKLLSAYIPLSSRDRLFFGCYGMATRAALDAGSLTHLLRLAPKPWIALLGMASLAACAVAGRPGMAAAIGVACGLSILTRRSPFYLLVVPGLAIQLLVGLFRYHQRPVVSRLAEAAGPVVPLACRESAAAPLNV